MNQQHKIKRRDEHYKFYCDTRPTVRRLSPLAGNASGSHRSPNHFIVSFSYYAHAKTFCDKFTSPVAMEKGETFPVFYNPLNPQQNNPSEHPPASRMPLFAVGIAGSIVISLLYLAMMIGCY